MKAYLTVLDGDVDIVPYFVRYLIRYGVDTFQTLIYGSKQDANYVESIVKAEGAECTILSIEDAGTFSANKREAYIREVHKKGEVAFFLDCDEFPCLTKKQLKQLHKKKFPYIAGNWIDRVSSTGELTPIVQGVPLEVQYPMEGQIRKHLKGGNTCYVASPFAPMSHHPTTCAIGHNQTDKALWVPVHHFKYQGNVIERLEKRLVRIEKVGKKRTQWYARVKRTIDFLKNHNGIPLKLLKESTENLGIV